MTSSKEEKPLVLRQKKKSVDEDKDDEKFKDQDVTVAFKKLRVDIEGNCIERLQEIEDPKDKELEKSIKERSQAADSSDELCQLWRKSLKKFCFCQKRVSKQGKVNVRYCRHHRFHEKHDTMFESSSLSLNLAYAAVSYRPLLHEGRLKLSSDEKPASVLRSSKLKLKKPIKSSAGACKLSVIPESDNVSNTCAAAQDDNSLLSVETAKNQNSATSSDADDVTASVTGITVFAEAANKRSVSFSSLLCKLKSSSQSDSEKKEPLLRFEGYRTGCGANNCGSALNLPSTNHHTSSSSLPSQRSSGSISLSDIAQSLPSASSPPRMVERSCSQEARLDESEINVNELAGYLENSLFMPKDMSSMAKMMYT